MKLDRKLRAGALGTVAAVVLIPVCSKTTLAQTQNTGGVETVVVTAEKTEENINNVGMSITAISGDQLQATGINDPDQLFKDVPGLTYTKSAYGQPVYSMRGVGYYDSAFTASPDVSVYLDQVPLPYTAMTRGILFDLQRVEVLKGPQGTLYGENATGGAINFIANKPTDTFSTGEDLGYSSYSEVTADAYVSGPVTDTLKIRLAGSMDEGGAWQQSYTRPDDHHGATRLFAGRLLVDWDPLSNLSFELNVNGWKDNSDTQAGQALAVISASPPPALLAALAVYPIPPTNAREADWDPGTPFGSYDPVSRVSHNGFEVDNSFLQNSLRADYNLGGGTILTSITSWERLEEGSLVDTDGMFIQNFNVSTGGSVETLSQELRLAGEGANGFHWLFGGNYEDDHMYTYGDPFSTVSTFPFPVSGAIAGTHQLTYAAFAHGSYAITDTLTLEAGIRYTEVNIQNSGCTLDGGDGLLAGVADFLASLHGVNVHIPPGGCVTLNSQTFEPGMVVGQLDQSNVPWTVDLNWNVLPTTMLYANVGRGFKAGEFSPAGALYSSALDPATQESLLAYEAGVKSQFDDNRVQLTGAFFYYDYSNKQIRGKIEDPVLGSLNKLINIPKSMVDGAELNLDWTPIDALHLSVGGSYTHSEILDNFTNYTVLGVYENLSGEALPLTPKLQLSADGEYNIPVADTIQGFLGAHVTYQGSSNAGLGDESLFNIAAYTTLDLRVGARSDDGHWSGTFFVNNVTDKYSWNFVNLSGPDVVSRLANLPRIFGVRLSYRY